MTTKRKRGNACAHESSQADLQKVVKQVDSAISALRTVLGMSPVTEAQGREVRLRTTRRSVKSCEA